MFILAGICDRAHIQLSEDHVGRALRTRRWMYEITAPDKDGWNNMNSESYIETSLYDLKADPHELNNLDASPAHVAIRETLRVRIGERCGKLAKGSLKF